MKKLLNPWLALITLTLALLIRIDDPAFVESIRLRYFDQLITSTASSNSEQVHVVNIDDEYIRQKGQFPFPRGQYASLISDLYSRGAGLVVFNVFMPDKDRFGQDKDLASLMTQVPVVLPQVAISDSYLSDKVQPFRPGVSVIGGEPETTGVQYGNINANIKDFNESAAGIGVVNTLPEIDGVTRRIPMVVNSNGQLFPSISLETLRVAAGDPSFQVKVGESGIEAVRIPQFGKIDTDSLGRIWVDWSRRPIEHSAASLPENFNGSIVIVGLTARGLNNPLATSTGSVFPHYLQAAVLDTVTSGTNISRPFWADFAEIGATVLITLFSLLLIRWKYGFIPVLSAVAGIYFGGSFVFNNYHVLLDGTFPIVAIMVVYIHAFTAKFLVELNAKLQIKKQFGTYLSPALVEKLQKNPELLVLGGETRQLSIMFTDVRGFTTISEHYGENVQGLTKIMNRYMTAMTAKILDNNGTLDKYIGDAQMAFWNAPVDDSDHAKHAVKTALEMLGDLDAFNKEVSKEGVPPFGMGLGINTADVVVGNMGSDQRFDYTCLGDGVNLASRLEGQSKPYGVKIVIGSLTADQIKDEYFVLELDKIAVKGKKEGVKIYTVLCSIEDSLEYKLSQQKHETMLQAYREKRWKDASLICNELLGEFNGGMDSYYKMMIERIADYEYRNKPPADWDGTFICNTK